MNAPLIDRKSLIARLEARYAHGAPDLAAVWSHALDGLLGHRSSRAYLREPLEPGVLEAIVAAAQSASTSSNLQLWSVVAIEDDDRKARLADLAGGQKHIRQAPLFLVWLADLARARALAEAHAAPSEALDSLESLITGVVDASLAAQNAVVALESLGLGSVYIGGIRNRPEDVAAELGLPGLVMPVFGLCVGRPDPAAPAAVKPRLPQQAVLHRERYDTAAEADALHAYEAAMRAFQQAQGLPADGWISTVLRRIGASAALNGRERLRSALERLGFHLH